MLMLLHLSPRVAHSRVTCNLLSHYTRIIIDKWTCPQLCISPSPYSSCLTNLSLEYLTSTSLISLQDSMKQSHKSWKDWSSLSILTKATLTQWWTTLRSLQSRLRIQTVDQAVTLSSTQLKPRKTLISPRSIITFIFSSLLIGRARN
jgi:hypothetical protein